MQKNRIKVENWILYVFFVFNVFVFVNKSFNHIIINKTIGINLTIVIIFWIIRKNVSSIALKVFFLIIAITMYMLATFVARNSMNDLVSIILALLIFAMCSSVTVSGKSKKVITWIFGFAFIVMVLQSKNYYDYFMKEYFNGNTAVINSNTIGFMFLFLCIMLCAFIHKGKKWTIIIFLINLFTIWGIVQSQCRSALVAYMVWVLLYMIPFKYYRNKKLVMAILGTELLVCNLFPYIVLYVGKKLDVTRFSALGKRLDSGRLQLWKNFFDAQQSSPLYGFFGIDNIKNDISGSALHNSYLNMQVSFGILGTFLLSVTIIAFFIRLFKLNKLKNQQIILMIGFFAILVNCCFETYLLYSLITPFIYSLLGLLYSLGGTVKDDKKNQVVVNNNLYVDKVV